MSLNRYWSVGLLVLAIACFVTGTASAQLTYVTARPTPSGAGANPDGTYHEFTSSGGSIVLGDSSAKSSATGTPSRSGSRAYLSSTPLANPAAGFSLSPTLPGSGGIYLLEYTFNAAAGNINTDLILAVSSTNCSLSFSSTDKFQASFGNSTWQTIGYLTNAASSSKPWLDFRYLSGYVTASKRLDIDCFRFTCLTPIILAQPASRTNNAGTTATFSVSASGTGTLSYRWRKEDVALADGGNVSGAATATLSLSNVLKTDEGGYSVVVSSQYGSVTSAVAVLTVIDPQITGQPLSQLKYVGQSATFSVTAVGTPPLSYQWWKDGGPLAAATDSSLTLINLQRPDAGSYFVVVTNQYGSLTSAVATLTVIDPHIAAGPLSQDKNVGESVTLSVTVFGTPPLSYQWWKDGEALAPATESSLLLTNLQLSDAGNYSVVVSNQYGCVTSLVAVLRVYLGTLHAFYFNSPASTNGLVVFQAPAGGGYLNPTNGSPNDPEAADPSTNGYLVLTDAVESQHGVVIFPDFDSGFIVKGFQFSCDVRVGAGSSIPADGFSICFARTDDPVLVNNNGSGWAGGGCGEVNLTEEGTQTGLAVCFDAYDNGCGDVIGLTVRVNNKIVTNLSRPYANLAPGHANFAASLQTGTNNAGLAGLTWQPLSVEYATNGLLSVAYKGVTLLSNFATALPPTVGRLILGSRTGLYYENHHIDNLRIATVPTTSPVVGAALGNYYGFTIKIYDSGAATADTNTLTVQLDGTTIISNGTNVSSEATSVTKSGGITTIAYLQTAQFAPGSSHSVQVTFSGTGFSGTVDETRFFAAPTYVTRYVDVNSASPAPPYTNWATAATSIQDAVDAAVAGDEIVVTNGIYTTGGRAVGSSSLANRVVVDKPLTVRSVNGPEFTMIRGDQAPDTICGYGAIRCVYLANWATLVGFTLTNGATMDWNAWYDDEMRGGGVWCESPSVMVSNCVLSGNAAFYHGGGAYNGSLCNCTVSGNSAESGGGVYDGEVSHSVLTSNSATFLGGGAAYSMLNNCTLAANSASYYGGGAYGGTLNSCAVAGNSAVYSGGGACVGTLNNCTLSGNSADGGAGADNSTLNNCSVIGNRASYGGGALDSILHNCTLTGNSAAWDGGGAYGGTLNNCIVYYNTALVFTNFRGGTLNYCCTTPLPASGTSNITAEPLLTDSAHLSAASPCRGAGSAVYASGVDIDGEAWANPPAIGCDEFYPGAVTGPLTVALELDYTNAAVGEAVSFTGQILGHASASLWDFGDGAVVSNCPYASHAWVAAADYPVVLRAYNDTNPGGVSATVRVHVVMITPGTGTGLNGDYYSNRMDFAGVPTLSRLDSTVNFHWGEGSPDPLISADRFSVRWSGYVQPFYSETYTFYTTTDDGVRLWVNGQRIIDVWKDQSPTEWSGTIALTANEKYPIVMEYCENTVGALAMLGWSSESQPKRVVPQTQLYPAASSQPWLECAGINGGTNLILTWGGSYTLQTATNVVGPYTDLSGATSPYTNNLAEPQRFFRLISR